MGKNILLIDDDLEVLDSLKDYLELRGFDVTTLSNPKSSLRNIIVKRPDLILLDINMPDVDGFKVLDMVKGISLTKVPIIILSGESEPWVKEKAAELGAVDFLA